jgi:hypothetical protein
MERHYSRPRGFVGRNICHLLSHEGTVYGAFVGGSTPMHLPGRDPSWPLNCIINNLFFHIEGPYPLRNFAQKALGLWRLRIIEDWREKYGDEPIALESLVELPRIGEVYHRDGWIEVGQTKGYTCKRTSGKGTDSWSGRRVWDTVNLRPKRVFQFRLGTAEIIPLHSLDLAA